MPTIRQTYNNLVDLEGEDLLEEDIECWRCRVEETAEAKGGEAMEACGTRSRSKQHREIAFGGRSSHRGSRCGRNHLRDKPTSTSDGAPPRLQGSNRRWCTSRPAEASARAAGTAWSSRIPVPSSRPAAIPRRVSRLFQDV